MSKKICRILLCLFCVLAFGLSFTEGRAAAAAKSVHKNELVKEKGKIYYYNAKGKKVKKCWKTVEKKEYYFKEDGTASVGLSVIGRKQYLFSASGALSKDGLKKYKGKTYYADAKGVIGKGWKTVGGKQYYFDKNKGYMLKSTWISSKYVNKNGVYVKTKKRKMSVLKSQLQKKMKSYRGTWSVYVKNLDTDESFSINNRSMYAASLIKLYAMGAVYEKIDRGKIKETSVSRTINSMITVSDNGAFNTIVRKVGKTYVSKWCKNNGYKQTKQTHELPGESSIALGTGTGKNVTSVKDCGKFLEDVYRGKCVNKKYSAKMLKTLKKQKRRSKIPAGVPSGVTVANKTGEKNGYAHDAAIVYSRGADYIICVMVYRPDGGLAATGNIQALSKNVYQFFN